MVADFENISLDAAWDLNVMQALNDLSYLKAKDWHDKEMNKRLMKAV